MANLLTELESFCIIFPPSPFTSSLALVCLNSTCLNMIIIDIIGIVIGVVIGVIAVPPQTCQSWCCCLIFHWEPSGWCSSPQWERPDCMKLSNYIKIGDRLCIECQSCLDSRQVRVDAPLAVFRLEHAHHIHVVPGRGNNCITQWSRAYLWHYACTRVDLLISTLNFDNGNWLKF